MGPEQTICEQLGRRTPDNRNRPTYLLLVEIEHLGIAALPVPRELTGGALANPR